MGTVNGTGTGTELFRRRLSLVVRWMMADDELFAVALAFADVDVGGGGGGGCCWDDVVLL